MQYDPDSVFAASDDLGAISEGDRGMPQCSTWGVEVVHFDRHEEPTETVTVPLDQFIASAASTGEEFLTTRLACTRGATGHIGKNTS